MEADKVFDVAVIGAGVIGCAAAREMSRYQVKTAVFEKELDVACGNSSRNTGMLHAGFTYQPGSLKAECAVEGNQEFDQVARELEIPFKRTGKVVVGFDSHDMENILKYKAVGEKNGVKGLRIIGKEELNRLDSSAGGEFAMYVPDSGILDPMQYTIALAENACQNGAEFYFGRNVVSIVREGDIYRIHTSKGCYAARWVINCAGMYAPEISEMLGYPNYPTKGFKGEYFVLDKKAGKYLNIPVYPAPNDKGGFSTHATPTVDGNVLVGPDSYVTEDREDYRVTKEHLDGLIRDGQKMFSQMKRDYFIRNFAGIRWKRYDPETGEILDFMLESDEEHPNTVNLVGIESPGVTCALPLARRAVRIIAEKEKLAENPGFNPRRKGIRKFSEMRAEEKKAAVANDPNYGEVICRCENVTKAEILQAIHNPLGVHTVTGIKNRTRATMGRCQGGYCETRITKMIEEELGIACEEVRYSKENSWMFTGKVREEV
ncbi:NAD(P)/FAD-dependent oxidoreductase [Clostridium sp. AM58-1XD]|uniref:NAD(P)/FAD-dependent oxidoreductase n=1 Tax=Clostridium sp. AM58-1XD TaxID=2292307 RepID=UPI000E501ACF|nr:NAD(P)/FAD-dependent oxidoreductase [Clostridium sp. AM58-1XD]RGY99035.1 FAD/NAD(P)-binding oxidoreductase [Clostridium sp. AM58-1XD]